MSFGKLYKPFMVTMVLTLTLTLLSARQVAGRQEVPALPFLSTSTATFSGTELLKTWSTTIATPKAIVVSVEFTIQESILASTIVGLSSVPGGNWLSIVAAADFKLHVAGSGGQLLTTINVVKPGEPTKVVYIADGAGRSELWVNGVLEAESDVFNHVAYTGQYYVGGIWGSGFSGTISSFQVSNIAGEEIVGISFKDDLGRETAVFDGWQLLLGAGGLEALWSRRLPDVAGVAVDAEYHLLTQPGGYAHNGCEIELVIDGINYDHRDLLGFVNSTGEVHTSYNPATEGIKHILMYDTPRDDTLLNLYLEIYK